MRLRGVVLILVLFVLAQSVFALDFNASLTPDVRSIKTNESADFVLTISHNAKESESFTVYSPDINWNILLDEYPYLAQGTHELKLTITPLNVLPGVYSIPIYVKASSTNDVVKNYASIELASDQPNMQGRLPAIRAQLDFPSKVDPRVPVKLILTLDNRNNRALEDVIIKVRSDLINEDYTTNLGPNEKKQVDFKIEFPEKTGPRTDLLKVSILMKEEEKTYRYDVETKQYSVIQYGDVLVDEKKSDGWITKTNIVKFTNTGNTPRIASYKQNLGFVENWFTSSTPESQNGEWKFELSVNEEKTLKVYTSYVPLVLLIIFLTLATIAYFLFRSPIVLVKRTQVLRSTEGGINKLKVLLYIKNRSSQNVSNVRVIDIIPRLADFVEKNYEGTLNPSVIKKLEKGTLLKWNINVLEPSEERIIYYNVQNKLSVLEGLTLPVAVAKFNVKGTVERSTKSNVLDVSF